MYTEERTAVIQAAKGKYLLLRSHPVGYLLSSIAAGVYVGFGVLLAFTIGGLMQGASSTKILMGISFGVALSLVTMAGGELFTGNNFVMPFGAMDGELKWSQVFFLWVVCWIGNLIGGVLLALCFWGTGLLSGSVGEFMAVSAAAKMSVPLAALFLRGFLCNVLVCLAVWCGFRCKSEAGKLTMIFWCLFTFVTAGFEHSVANMTLLTIALLNPCGTSVTFAGWLYNLGVVTLGNIMGGLFCVAVPYFVISQKKDCIRS